MTDNPRRGANHPNGDPVLRPLRTGEAKRTDVELLGDVADDLRQLLTDFGVRPYTVRTVRVRWSGGEIGRGEPTVVFDLPLEPTPLVSDIRSVRRELGNAGIVARGDVRLSEVSPRYTEREIVNYFHQGMGPDEVGFIEVRIDDRDGQPERKRYVVAGTPERRAVRFDWTVTLTKQDGDRNLDGTASQPDTRRRKVRRP